MSDGLKVVLDQGDWRDSQERPRYFALERRAADALERSGKAAAARSGRAKYRSKNPSLGFTVGHVVSRFHAAVFNSGCGAMTAALCA